MSGPRRDHRDRRPARLHLGSVVIDSFPLTANHRELRRVNIAASQLGHDDTVEVTIAVHEEQEHVSVSQVGAGRYPFSAIDAVLVSERQLPRRVIAHEVEHSCCQLVMVDSRVPLRGDGVDCPRFGAICEELMPVALLPSSASS